MKMMKEGFIGKITGKSDRMVAQELEESICLMFFAKDFLKDC